MKCIYIKKLKELIENKPDNEYMIAEQLIELCDHEVFLEFHGSNEMGGPTKIDKGDTDDDN